jgi:hypothetical protein
MSNNLRLTHLGVCGGRNLLEIAVPSEQITSQETLTGAHRSANCMWLSKFLVCTTT